MAAETHYIQRVASMTARTSSPGVETSALVEGGLLGAFVVLLLMTPSDPDLWGHLRFGLDMLSSGHVVVPDVYAFTSDRAWVNHEWLSEFLMALSYRMLGTAGLQLLKLIVALGAYTFAARLAARHAQGWTRFLILTFVFVTGIYPLTHTIRPQIFSTLCFTILLTVLAHVGEGRLKMAAILPFLFAFWANTHGGWLVGGGVYALWTLWTIAQPATALRNRIWLLVVAGMSAAATLLTPYGLDLWRFLAETVRLGRPEIEEWLPLTENRELLIPWALTFVLALASAVKPTGRRWRDIAVAAMLAYASFRVSRIGAFFSLSVAALLLTPSAVTAAARPYSRSGRSALVGVCALIVTVALWRAPTPVTCLQPPDNMAMDNRAAAFIAAHDLRGRMVVWFNWGEYALWHFGPHLQVSLDGRRETIFTERTMNAHSALYDAVGDAHAYLDSLHADYIWLPPILRLNQRLSEWGWHQVFASDKSIVWAAHALPPRVRERTIATQCFPGA
jgi:hypothetical protein